MRWSLFHGTIMLRLMSVITPVGTAAGGQGCGGLGIRRQQERLGSYKNALSAATCGFAGLAATAISRIASALLL